jgi:hypothetical protein
VRVAVRLVNGLQRGFRGVCTAHMR